MKSKKHISQDSDDDAVSQNSEQLNTDNSPKFIPIAKLGDRLKTKRIVINLSDTQYPIVEEVAQQMGWIIQSEPGFGDWDVWWTDRQISPSGFFRMNMHQKINHYPGIFVLARKNLLGLNLMAMREKFPESYNFFPQTWIMPLQFSQFRQSYQNVFAGKTRTYIVKPQALSQGRGIFLTRNIDDIINGNKYVIQRYIKNPFLIDGLKFDLRIYVLIAGTQPLRLYIYDEGLTRFATQKYELPNDQNLGKSYIHLTNYSLNKSNPNYVYNTSDKDIDSGHKRTLSSTYQKFRTLGYDVDKLKLDIQEIITKTVISGLPHISHLYKWSQPEQYENNMCFHVLGFDVMLTDNLKPYLIEVNHTPSFETSTPLDYAVKKKLVKDTLTLMRITQNNKKILFEKAKVIIKKRVQTGKREIYRGPQRDAQILKAQIQRDRDQKDILGGYKVIHPHQDPQKQSHYNSLYQVAKEVQKRSKVTRKQLLKDQNTKNKKIEKISANQSPKKTRNTLNRNCMVQSSDIKGQEKDTTSRTNQFRTKVNRKRSSSEHITYDQTNFKKFNEFIDRMAKKTNNYTNQLFDHQDIESLTLMKDLFTQKKYSNHPSTNGRVQNKQGTFVALKTYSLSKRNSNQQGKQCNYSPLLTEEKGGYQGPKTNSKIRKLSIF